MNRTLAIILKTLVGFVLTIVVLVIAAGFLLNSRSVQEKIWRRATEMLSERLQTKVSIDSIDISIVHQQLRLYGLNIEDQEQRPMLSIKKAGVDLKLKELLNRRVMIEAVEMEGASALLLKPSKEEPANYQFIIDAFKKEPKEQRDSTKRKKKLEFDIHQVSLSDIQVKYNDIGLELEQADIKADKGLFKTSVQLRLTTDNHKPRKNTGKPKRGFFDVGHLDITSQLQIDVDATAKDTVRAEIKQFAARDSVTGIDIRELHAKARYAGDQLLLNDITVRQKDTELKIESARMVLPSKKEDRAFSFETGTITGTAYLRDISRAFAPVLSNFSLPLNLSLTMSGTDNTLAFRNVKVNTNDKRLTINATGDIKDLKDKEKLNVTFHVSHMNAKSGIKEKIISQFPVKRMMMKQLHNLGNISYTGSFRIIRKEERFWGLLNTAAGSLNFQFWLDERNKYVIGNAQTKNLEFGKVMEMDNLGPMAASAKFKIDISKPRTAKVRKEKGGKLPIGNVEATVEDCSYKKIHIRNLSATIKSDGALASGDIFQHGNRRDIYFSFSLTNTDEMQKLKITNPGIKFHKISEEDKEAKKLRKEERKEQRKQLKEQKREEKKQLKEQKKQQKEQEKKEKGEKKRFSFRLF